MGTDLRFISIVARSLTITNVKITVKIQQYDAVVRNVLGGSRAVYRDKCMPAVLPLQTAKQQEFR